jgi:hypothetical protein
MTLQWCGELWRWSSVTVVIVQQIHELLEILCVVSHCRLARGKLHLYLHASCKGFSTWFLFVTFEAVLLEPYWLLLLQGERMLQWFQTGRLIQGALMRPIHSICVPSIALIIWVKQHRRVHPSQVRVYVFLFFLILPETACAVHMDTQRANSGVRVSE